MNGSHTILGSKGARLTASTASNTSRMYSGLASPPSRQMSAAANKASTMYRMYAAAAWRCSDRPLAARALRACRSQKTVDAIATMPYMVNKTNQEPSTAKSRDWYNNHSPSARRAQRAGTSTSSSTPRQRWPPRAPCQSSEQRRPLARSQPRWGRWGRRGWLRS